MGMCVVCKKMIFAKSEYTRTLPPLQRAPKEIFKLCKFFNTEMGHRI